MGPAISQRLLATQSDERLVALAQAGHVRAFEALVHRHRRPLLSYCRRVVAAPEHAEDVLQQGLLQAWTALGAGTEVREPRAWLYRIVHNAAISSLRRAGGDHVELSEALPGSAGSDEAFERVASARDALAGIAALPELQREVVMRAALDGASYDDLAGELGLSPGAVRGLLHRARTTLRSGASALTPGPLLNWLGGGPGRLVLGNERLAGLGAGGSAGVGGLLLKGGAIAVTAGALVTVPLVSHRLGHGTPHHAAAGGAPRSASARPGGASVPGRPELASAGAGETASKSPSGAAAPASAGAGAGAPAGAGGASTRPHQIAVSLPVRPSGPAPIAAPSPPPAPSGGGHGEVAPVVASGGSGASTPPAPTGSPAGGSPGSGPAGTSSLSGSAGSAGSGTQPTGGPSDGSGAGSGAPGGGAGPGTGGSGGGDGFRSDPAGTDASASKDGTGDGSGDAGATSGSTVVQSSTSESAQPDGGSSAGAVTGATALVTTVSTTSSG